MYACTYVCIYGIILGFLESDHFKNQVPLPIWNKILQGFRWSSKQLNLFVVYISMLFLQMKAAWERLMLMWGILEM